MAFWTPRAFTRPRVWPRAKSTGCGSPMLTIPPSASFESIKGSFLQRHANSFIVLARVLALRPNGPFQRPPIGQGNIEVPPFLRIRGEAGGLHCAFEDEPPFQDVSRRIRGMCPFREFVEWSTHIHL